LALATGRPTRNFLVWTGAIAALMTAYVFYHRALHGLTPLLSYVVDPHQSISVWGLVWNSGYEVSPQLARTVPLPLLAAALIVFSMAAHRKRLPLAFAMAGVLLVTLLALSVTSPGYILWVIPLMLISLLRMSRVRERVAAIALLLLWGAGEWGANFFRGVNVALTTERSGGKTAIASAAERLLGPAFPYHWLHMGCIAVVIVSGVGQLLILWRAGRRIGLASETSITCRREAPEPVGSVLGCPAREE